MQTTPRSNGGRPNITKSFVKKPSEITAKVHQFLKLLKSLIFNLSLKARELILTIACPIDYFSKMWASFYLFLYGIRLSKYRLIKMQKKINSSNS